MRLERAFGKAPSALTRTQGKFDLPARFCFSATGTSVLVGCAQISCLKKILLPRSHLKKDPSVVVVSERGVSYLARLSGPFLDRIDLVAWSSILPPEIVTDQESNVDRLIYTSKNRYCKSEKSFSIGW
jgi:hypothetical protein